MLRLPVEMALGLAGLPPVVAQLLHTRGMVSRQGIDPYLNPQPHDPNLLSDMARTVDRITQAIANHEAIGVFGGHKQAAGFEMTSDHLSALEQRMGLVAEKAAAMIQPQAVLDIDAEVPLSSVPGETFRWIKELKPFGMQNPAPRFLVRNLIPVEARFMGNKKQHLKLKLKEGRGAVWDAIAFRQGERWAPNVPLVDIVYTIGTEQRGNAEVLALKVLDFQPSGRLL